MTVLVVLIVLVGLVVMVRRGRRRAGSSLERTYTAEPPPGRLGQRGRERL